MAHNIRFIQLSTCAARLPEVRGKGWVGSSGGRGRTIMKGRGARGRVIKYGVSVPQSYNTFR